MLGLFAAMDFNQQLARLAARHTTAFKAKATQCQKCGFCCWRAPGGFLPNEVQALARRKRLSVPEVFKRYLTVHDMGEDDDRYTVIAVRHRQSHEAGGYLSASGSFALHAPCVFLDENTNLCSLHGTDAQPTECRVGLPCLNDHEDGDTRIWTPRMLRATFDFDIHAAKSAASYSDWDD